MGEFRIEEIVLLLVVLALVVYLCRRFSPQIYDAVIVKMTALWYKEVLLRVPAKARVLDIGIGTGTSLCRNATLVRDKELEVTGVDIDRTYVGFCQKQLAAAGLGSSRAVCKSVFDEDLASVVGSEFDAVYFSGSIALMPEPHRALQIAASLLRPAGGQVYVTQTFQRKSVPFLSVLKPLLYYLTTIDFGRLTFEHEVDAIVARSGLQLVEKSLIPNSVDNAYQGAFLLVLKR